MDSFVKTTCVKCKIYFGSEERLGMCSVCFKDSKSKENIKTEAVNQTSEINTNITTPIISEDVKMEEPKPDVQPQENIIPINTKPVQANKHSCWVCNKRVGYSGFLCKCEYIFCGSHRHFSDHNCDFDYKKYDREKLVKKSNFGESADKMIK